MTEDDADFLNKLMWRYWPGLHRIKPDCSVERIYTIFVRPSVDGEHEKRLREEIFASGRPECIRLLTLAMMTS